MLNNRNLGLLIYEAGLKNMISRYKRAEKKDISY